jgi:hypothetical protein
MAKAARFKIGSSGSGKHTEMQGTGEGMGGPASRPSEMGPRIGSGVMGRRVTPEYDRDAGGDERGRPKVRDVKTYSEE